MCLFDEIDRMLFALINITMRTFLLTKMHALKSTTFGEIIKTHTCIDYECNFHALLHFQIDNWVFFNWLTRDLDLDWFWLVVGFMRINRHYIYAVCFVFLLFCTAPTEMTFHKTCVLSSRNRDFAATINEMSMALIIYFCFQCIFLLWN